jgi:hypothetical protein
MLSASIIVFGLSAWSRLLVLSALLAASIALHARVPRALAVPPGSRLLLTWTGLPGLKRRARAASVSTSPGVCGTAEAERANS